MNMLVNTYYDISKLVIWGDSEQLNDNTKRPRLVFSFRDGNPRLTVYTGETGANGVIAFPSDIATMMGIVSLIKDIITAEPGTKYSIDSLTTQYVDNKPTNDKRIVSTLYVGKSKEGLIYFSVISENKPKLVFTIKTSPYHVFRDKDKNVLNESVVSCSIAKGLVDIITNIISNIVLNYTEEDYKLNKKPYQIKSKENNKRGAEINSIDDIDI